MYAKGIIRKKADISTEFIGGDINIIKLIDILYSLEKGIEDKFIFEYDDENKGLLGYVEINVDTLKEKIDDEKLIDEADIGKEDLEMIKKFLITTEECIKIDGFIRIDCLF